MPYSLHELQGVWMKKSIGLSLIAVMAVYAAPSTTLESIEVEAKTDTEVVKDVSGEEIKSADLGEALFKTSPSVALVRRSGIANDIIVRGQKKDNIVVTIDGAKVCGACPNRMDPPISHVLTNNVDYIQIDEGPFNVEDFGSLSANVKVNTLKPSKEFTGEVGLNFGSWDYNKQYFHVSGGTENVRFLLSASNESGGQYKDGDGNDFVEQQNLYIASHLNGDMVHDMQLKGLAYLPTKRDMDAFKKKTVMAKLFFDIADNQELRLSYTANRSDNILYPNTPMDAIYDDSDIYNLEYIATDLGEYSKKLNLNLYQTEVEHPMSNDYRMSSNMMVMTHALTTKVQGAKLKNEFEAGSHSITVGLDYSKRNWDGKYYMNGMPLMAQFHSIWDVDTKNAAFFVNDKIKMDQWQFDMGLRYDDTTVSTANPAFADKDYNGLSGNAVATYHVDETTKYFVGAGISHRVPDGRELYFYDKSGLLVGNPNLKKVTNNEIDLGAEKTYGDIKVQGKVFYSTLEDYIAYNATTGTFENVDAKIYGLDLKGTWFATEALSFDAGVSLQRGKKKDALTGQTDLDLPEIPPFKLNIAANYEVDETLTLNAEIIAADKWTNYDFDNGEQELGGYGVLNLKGTKTFAKNFELTVGVDNVFDKTYATSNTYKDLTLIYGGGDVMLLNEPGRYVYANLKYSF